MKECNIMVTDKGYAGLNPIILGYQDCPKAHFFGPAVRTHWLIHFVVSGFGIYKIRGKTYPVKPGEMFVIPPYIETYYEADRENPWSYIWIGFTAEHELPQKLPDVIRCPEARSVFQAMKNCEDFSDGRSAYLSARLWDFFALVLDEKKSDDDYVKKALDCIHSEYMNGITVTEIANRLNLDRTYFSVIFKKEVGVSPKQYLLDYRMDTASFLMTEKHIPISVVAFSVGYSDIFTFSKMFKRHFGLAPKEYIKQHKKGM